MPRTKSVCFLPTVPSSGSAGRVWGFQTGRGITFVATTMASEIGRRSCHDDGPISEAVPQLYSWPKWTDVPEHAALFVDHVLECVLLRLCEERRGNFFLRGRMAQAVIDVSKLTVTQVYRAVVYAYLWREGKSAWLRVLLNE